MRVPSKKAIQRRAERDWDRAQALSRNEDYQRAVAELKPDADGFSYDISERYLAICQRAGLEMVVLPERLRTLTVGELEDYAAGPIFSDIPGWAWDVRDRTALVQALRELETGRRQVLDLREWRKRRVVSEFRLGKRVRRGEGPEAIRAQCWRVWDLRRSGRSEREIIGEMWPNERPANVVSGWEKTPLRQRVYDYENLAKRLIKLAYGEPGPVASQQGQPAPRAVLPATDVSTSPVRGRKAAARSTAKPPRTKGDRTARRRVARKRGRRGGRGASSGRSRRARPRKERR